MFTILTGVKKVDYFDMCKKRFTIFKSVKTCTTCFTKMDHSSFAC